MMLVALFGGLNALLLLLHPSAVPRHAFMVTAVGWVLLILLRTQKEQRVTIEKTVQFHRMFQVLSLCEVLCTLILPWWLLIKEYHHVSAEEETTTSIGAVGYMLAPHLFVFQAQIALEGLIMTNEKESKQHRPGLLFYYTCVANAYRGIAIATWMVRWQEILGKEAQQEQQEHILFSLLPAVTAFLWICSNCFIVFVWYPCLRWEKAVEKKKL